MWTAIHGAWTASANMSALVQYVLSFKLTRCTTASGRKHQPQATRLIPMLKYLHSACPGAYTVAETGYFGIFTIITM